MPILGYHSIDDDWENPLAVTFGAFERQMHSVKERVIPLRDYARLWQEQSLTGREIALTFDDGYLDNYQRAFPLLHELGIPATVFLPSDLLGGTHDFGTGHHKAVMSPEQVRDLASLGIDVGAHSATHPDMRSLDDEELKQETLEPKRMLEELLGYEVPFFCYPAGYYNTDVLNAVSKAGFGFAVVTPNEVWRRQTALTLRRVGIWRGDSDYLFRFRLSWSGNATRWLVLAGKDILGGRRARAQRVTQSP